MNMAKLKDDLSPRRSVYIKKSNVFEKYGIALV